MRKPTLFLIVFLVLPLHAFAAETIIVAACGSTPGITQTSYSGLIEVTVSGSMVNFPPANGSDGFYGILNGELVGPAPGEFRLARTTTSTNTCGLVSTVHFPVTDFLVGDYPEANPAHVYTVRLDIGDPPDRLVFGIRDCGCFDNSGELTVTVETVPEDFDGDGVLDPVEDVICHDTPPGAVVNPLGCSIEQICPCSNPWGRVEWRNRGEYVACVFRAASEFVDRGLISVRARHRVMRTASQSSCGAQ